MLENLVQQFLGSGEGASLVQTLTQEHGISAQEAEGAVAATAEGAASALSSEGGGLDLGSLVGGLVGGGGLGGLLGGDGAPSPQLAQTVATFVSEKTGLSAGIATTVVNLVLPKVIAFAKDKLAGGGEGGKDGGGILGGLF